MPLHPRQAIAIAAALVVISAAGLYAFWGRSGATSLRPDATDPEQVASGRQLYEAHCASCHGKDLEGQPNWQSRLPSGELPAPPHDETGHTWHHPDAILFRITKFGGAAEAPPGFRSAMPAFGPALSDKEIRNILAYIKSRWPGPIRSRQADIDQRYRSR